MTETRFATDPGGHPGRGRCWLRRLGIALLVLGAILALAWAAVAWQFQRSLPRLEGMHTAPGLERPVGISFDAWWRPHVRAEGLEDALYAQGCLHASERAWQMELLRGAGLGRLAGMLGPPLLDTGVELWRMGVPQLAEQLMANASPDRITRLQQALAGNLAFSADDMRVLQRDWTDMQAAMLLPTMLRELRRRLLRNNFLVNQVAWLAGELLPITARDAVGAPAFTLQPAAATASTKP